MKVKKMIKKKWMNKNINNKEERKKYRGVDKKDEDEDGR